jgi:predicted protein tyrosine phosphatase
MLREIHIRGHAVNTAQQFLAGRPGEFHCLLITDFGYPFPDGIRERVGSVMHLAFDDACFRTGLHRLADRTTVQQALAWAERRDKLLIACHAGISRSAALAFLIACTDRPPEQALNLLDPEKHRPNDLVVMLGSNILGNRQIWDTFLGWCRRHEIGDWQHRQSFLEEWGSELEMQ